MRNLRVSQAALQMAMKLMERHGQLNTQIEELEAELIRRVQLLQKRAQQAPPTPAPEPEPEPAPEAEPEKKGWFGLW